MISFLRYTVRLTHTFLRMPRTVEYLRTKKKERAGINKRTRWTFEDLTLEESEYTKQQARKGLNIKWENLAAYEDRMMMRGQSKDPAEIAQWFDDELRKSSESEKQWMGGEWCIKRGLGGAESVDKITGTSFTVKRQKTLNSAADVDAIVSESSKKVHDRAQSSMLTPVKGCQRVQGIAIKDYEVEGVVDDEHKSPVAIIRLLLQDLDARVDLRVSEVDTFFSDLVAPQEADDEEDPKRRNIGACGEKTFS